MLHIIMGPPCAGKTTYALAHRQAGEIVLDLDAICSAIGGRHHGCRGSIRAIATAMRNAAIDAAISKGVTAWVIHSNPAGDYMRFYKAVGAELLCIDPGIETCKRRARDSGRPNGTIAAIDSWYKNHGSKTGTAQASRNW